MGRKPFMPRKPIDVLDRRARVLPFYAKGNHVFGSTAVSPVANGSEVVAPRRSAKWMPSADPCAFTQVHVPRGKLRLHRRSPRDPKGGSGRGREQL